MDRILDDWGRRMAIRRRMLAHLGVDIEDMAAPLDTSDIRATLCACTQCRDPKVCEGWISQNRPGLPAFCGARTAFLNLVAAAESADGDVAGRRSQGAIDPHQRPVCPRSLPSH
jgi:hypothetical protein